MPFELVEDKDGNEVWQYVMPTEKKENDLKDNQLINETKDNQLINETKDNQLINENNNTQQRTARFSPLKATGLQKVKPIAQWVLNTNRAAYGHFIQEAIVDYSLNDFWENKKLDPNSSYNNNHAHLGSAYRVENDPLWVIDWNGDRRSLKTGEKYVDGYLRSLLNLSTYTNLTFSHSTGIDKDQTSQLMSFISNRGILNDRKKLLEWYNNNPDKRIEHPALTKAGNYRNYITTYNADKAPSERIGPTGDFGVPVDRQVFGQTVKERFQPEGGYEHGEETVGTILSYLVPTALLMWGTRSLGGKLPPNVKALSPLKALDKTKKGKLLASFIRNTIEGAIEGGQVAYVLEGNTEGDGTFLGIGKKINTTDNNARRREIARMNDYLLGAVFGNVIGLGLDFGIPAVKSLAGLKSSKKTSNQLNLKLDTDKKGIVDSTIDPIVDIIYKTGKFIVDLQNFEIAENQLKLAKELQEQGPTDLKKVIPTTNIKRTDPMEFYRNKIEKEDVIQQKATQKELDDQVTNLEKTVEKQRIVVDKDAADLANTTDNVIATTEYVDDIPNILKEAKTGDRKVTDILRSKARDITQSDARTLRKFDEAFKNEDEVLKQTRKGRKKIEPGTPHPTDPNKVRGYNSRWVTKKHFDQVTESKKGGNKIRRQFGLPEERTAFETKLDEANKLIENQKLSEEKGINKIFTEQGIKDFLADLDIEQSKLNKKIGQLGPSIEDATKRGKKAEFIKAVERNFEISRERDLAKKQRKNIKEGNKEAEKTFKQIEAEVEAEVNSMTDAEIRESLRQDPELAKLIDDLERVDAKIESNLKKWDDLLTRSADDLKFLDEMIDENNKYMDSLDEQIFNPKTTVEDRIKLEKLYKSADATRQDLKLQKKYQAEHLTNEIGTKPETVESPLTEPPFFAFNIKGAKPRYRQMSIEFESDVDRAIYIVTKRQKGSGPAKSRPIYIEQSNKDASSANHKYLAFLYENGLRDEDILEYAPKIYNKLADNYSANSVYNLEDTGAWKNGSDFDFEIEYDPEKDLEKFVRDLDKQRTEEYRRANDPQDPGDQLDPNINYETSEPKLPDFLPQKGNKGKAYEEQLILNLPTKDAARNLHYNKVLADAEFGIGVKGWNEILDTIERVAGPDARIRLDEEINKVWTKRAALEYGQPELAGTPVRGRGAYSPKNDLVIMAVMHKGKYVEFSRALRTAYHESFHRLQTRFLSEAEIEVLNEAAPQLRELVLKVFPELGEAKINKLGNRELQAWAFAAWTDSAPPIKKLTWQQPLRKMAQIIESILPVFRSRYETWDDLFDAAYKGEIAKRQKKAIIDSQLDFEIDPDEVRDLAKEYGKRIEDGEITLDEAMNNKGEDMSRRFLSRSGKTDYIDRTNRDLITLNKTFQDAIEETLGARADQTNIPSKTLDEILRVGKRQVEDDGYDMAKTINLYDRARKNDLTSQQDLYALAGLLYHTDFTLSALLERFIAKETGLDDAATIINNKRILSLAKDYLTLSGAYVTAMRKIGQLLKIGQINFEGVNLSTMPPRQPVTYTASKIDADTILKKGFQPTEGSLGKGVYFSTEAKPGNVGDIKINGETKSDVYIADLVETGRSITELVKELDLGDLKVTKDGIQLTPKQQEGIQSWAQEKGYGGIRYGTDFKKSTDTTDEIIIFDTNNANRFVDSDAAIPPIPEDSTPIKPLIDQSIETADNFITQKLPEQIIKDINEGKVTKETQETLEILGRITYEVKNTRGGRKGFYDLFTGIPDGQADKQALLNVWRNLLFLAPSTWYKVLFGSAYRTAVLPISQIMGFTQDIIVDKVLRKSNQIADESTGMTREMLNKRRIKLSAMTYQKYLQHSTYAMRMMVASFKENEVFVNIGRRQIEGRTKDYATRQQLELNFETALNENTEGLHTLADPNLNPLAHVIIAFNSISGRSMGSIDSFYAAMVGPSTEWTRIMDEQLDKALRDGFKEGSNEQWQEASQETDKILKQLFQDVDLANGQVIKNGRLKGKHAQNAMDWVNFTNDVEVKPETRTHEFGVKKGRQKGITDSRELLEYAEDYVNIEPSENLIQGGLRGGSQALNVYGKTIQKLHGGNAGEQLIGGLISPINRTPVNLTKDLLTAMPMARDFVDSFQRDIASEDVFTRARANGYMATAWSILATGYGLVQTGYVEFSQLPSTNTSERYQDQRIGIQNFGIRIRNPVNKEWGPWVDLSPFDLMGTILSSIGSFTYNYQNLTEYEKTHAPLTGNALFAAEMHTIFKTIRDVGLAQGIKQGMGGLIDIADLISGTLSKRKAYEGSRDPWEKFFSDKIASWYPSVIRQASRSLDPYVRHTRTSFTVNGEKHRGMHVNIINTILKNIPGLSQTQPPVLDDIDGLPIRNSYILGSNNFKPSEPILKLSNDLFLPQSAFKARDESISATHQELYRLRGRGSYFRIWSPRVFNLPRRKLDELELNRLKVIGTQEVKIGGLTLAGALNKTIREDPFYLNLPEENVDGQTSEKVKYLQKIIRPYVEKAKTIYRQELIKEYKEALANDEPISKNHLGKLILENDARKNKSMSINQTEVNSGVDSWLNTPSLN